MVVVVVVKVVVAVGVDIGSVVVWLVILVVCKTEQAPRSRNIKPVHGHSTQANHCYLCAHNWLFSGFPSTLLQRQGNFSCPWEWTSWAKIMPNKVQNCRQNDIASSKPEIAPGSSLKLATLPRRGSVIWSQSYPPTHSVLQNEEMCYFILFPSTFAETYKLKLMFTTTTRIPNTVCGWKK